MTCTFDLAVLGAGPAGRAAALAAARAGQGVLLLDEGDIPPLPGVRTAPRRLVWIVAGGNQVEALGPQGRETWLARRVLQAAVRPPSMLPFPGWSLSGVGALGDRCAGRRVVLAGEGPSLRRAARRLFPRLAAVADLARGWTVAAAYGTARVERVRLHGPRGRRPVFLAADAVLMGYGRLPPPLVAALPPGLEVCPCEGVTRQALDAAIDDGATDMNQLRSFTRCGMGLCQGRLCAAAAAALLHARTGNDPVPFTPRPPLRPVRLGDLIGEFTYADIPVPAPAPL